MPTPVLSDSADAISPPDAVALSRTAEEPSLAVAPLRVWPYRVAGLTSIQFMVLTAGAMLLYPGGTNVDRATRGYSFLHNFFSDLGMTVAHNQSPNRISAVLFFIALACAGAGLAAFAATLPQLFRHRRDLRVLSLAGSALGVVSGLAYIGIAFTPANLQLGWHMRFVQLAFRSFLVVVLLYGAATWRHGEYPRRYAVGWLAFAVVLAGYVWLLIAGPSARTEQGLLIQAAGQKIIAYSSILCVWWQCRGAMQLATKMELAQATSSTTARPVAA
jgi:hypothetical membrane protein